MDEKVDLAILLSGAQRYNDGNYCDTWVGMASYGRRKRTKLFVKRLPTRALFIEVISAQIGRFLKLPVPRPFLVRVLPTSLPDAGLSKSEIFFGSENADYPTLARMVKVSDIEERLTAWPYVVAAACFDEWIANDDRHSKNILYGGNNKFVLIDHSHAMRADWHPRAPLTKNSLLQISQRSPALKSKEQLLELIKQKHFPDYSDILKNDWKMLADSSEYCSASVSEEVLTFLNTRLVNLGTIIHESLDVFQGDLYAGKH